jgi:hypothetical protein
VLLVAVPCGSRLRPAGLCSWRLSRLVNAVAVVSAFGCSRSPSTTSWSTPFWVCSSRVTRIPMPIVTALSKLVSHSSAAGTCSLPVFSSTLGLSAELGSGLTDSGPWIGSPVLDSTCCPLTKPSTVNRVGNSCAVAATVQDRVAMLLAGTVGSTRKPTSTSSPAVVGAASTPTGLRERMVLALVVPTERFSAMSASLTRPRSPCARQIAVQYVIEGWRSFPTGWAVTTARTVVPGRTPSGRSAGLLGWRPASRNVARPTGIRLASSCHAACSATAFPPVHHSAAQ